MKKIFAFVAATVLFAGLASAQLGIHVGYAPQTYKTTFSYSGFEGHDTTSMTGFFVGIDYNYNISGDLGVCIGIQGRYNTHSEETTVLSVTTKSASNQMILDVPILFNYGLNLTDDIRLTVFAGPTFNYALNGKTTITVGSNETESDWYDDNSDLNRFDVAGTLGVNLTFNGIRLFGGYNMGLMNLSSDDNTTMKGSNWFIGVGYNL